MFYKIINITFAIIGWFFAFIFIVLGIAYHNYIFPFACYLICAFLACPLIKRVSTRLRMWIRIPLVFVLFIFATIQIPKSNNTAQEEDIAISDDERIEYTFTRTKASKDFYEETSKENAPEHLEEPETILSEEDFKNACIEIIYNDLDNEWIGKYVTKEILFTSTEKDEYECASTESFIEDLDIYQHVYTIYDIYDCRFDKSFPIYANDVIRIYGIITDVKTNYANGLEYPIIDMYYADYIREWKKSEEEAKSMDELTQERKTEKERTEAENEYYNSLNSDYTGQTKNIDNMDQLNEEEFKAYCDSMNFKNMFYSSEDLSGRYVKIHVQLTTHKIFKSEESKRTRLNDLVDIYHINDNVWYSKLFFERAGEYVGNPILLYFADNNIYDLDSLKTDQKLVVYGLVMNYEVKEEDSLHNKFDFLGRVE